MTLFYAWRPFPLNRLSECESVAPHKTLPGSGRVGAVLLCLTLIVSSAPAVFAEDGCTVTQTGDPLRQIISCGEAVTIEREPAADITIFKPRGDAPPRAIELLGGGLLVNVTPGSARPEIKTPHAIAAVRGTTYVVDAGADRTSVFVITGSVDVSKVEGGRGVTLGPGDGIDVQADQPLSAAQWPADRAAALLARFGR